MESVALWKKVNKIKFKNAALKFFNCDVTNLGRETASLENSGYHVVILLSNQDQTKELTTTRIHPSKQCATLAPKLFEPLYIETAPPFLFLDPVLQTGSTHILYYLNMYFRCNK
jgi:hypothetical protein